MQVRFKKYIALLTMPLVLLLVNKQPLAVHAQGDSWQPTTAVDAPDGRRGHTTLWTGTEMLVWGGESGAGGCTLNTGSRYNPATDSWQPITTVGAPEMRRYHTAVWTGTEMIVWGGEACNSGPTYNTGGRYNPVTDTWTTMSIVNVPSGRYGHRAIWTGTEMIVWGGDLDSPDVILTNTGGRYNPATDTWTPTSLVGAPTARQAQTSVWTGNEMIVWGGITGCCGAGSETPNGDLYNPRTDTWRSMAPLSADDALYSQAFVWTGSEMIVWGGFGQFNVKLNTGQRYNPATNTWIPMTPTGAPTARFAGGVWTGSQMIVWGGNDVGGPTNSGALYDPVHNSWTPMTNVNAPIPGLGQGVWTGTEMLVWGGFYFDGIEHFMNIGARYRPTASFATNTPTATNQPSPTATSVITSLHPLGNIVQVAAGYDHTCALTNAGGVKCWGRNDEGQVGDVTTTTRSTAVDVVGLTTGVRTISAGAVHTCALTTGDGVRCWGSNQHGQLGELSSLTSGVSAISAGTFHTCVLTNEGGVKCWGDNNYGQLGNNSFNSRSTPEYVTGLTSGVIAVASGGFHTCALLQDSTVKCWGYNSSGQVGDNTHDWQLTPVAVVNLSEGINAVALGTYSSCVLTTASGVKCWGNNEYGGLGDGSTNPHDTPQSVPSLTSGVTALSLGDYHTCALTSIGGVKCWGNNWGGQVSTSNIVSQTTPGDIAGLSSGITSISAGHFYNCAVTSRARVKCWGPEFILATGRWHKHRSCNADVCARSRSQYPGTHRNPKAHRNTD